MYVKLSISSKGFYLKSLHDGKEGTSGKLFGTVFPDIAQALECMYSNKMSALRVTVFTKG
jgi:hypothetical protein